MKLTKEQVMGIIRHGLTFVGGILIMKGVIDDATSQEIIGSAISLIGLVWSVVDKNKA
jgi:hypothetical protein